MGASRFVRALRLARALQVASLLLAAALALPARAATLLGPVGEVNEPFIAGRAVALDARGQLLPWPYPHDAGRSYDAHARAQWAVLRDALRRTRLPYFTCCFRIDGASGELVGDYAWVNSTAYLRSMVIGYVERLYPYTGDASMLGDVEAFVDYELEHGLTPAGHAWSRVPYPSADPGASEYTGWSVRGHDFVEPHEIGEDGYAYLRLYEMDGQRRYLDAAIHYADELVKHQRVGDADHSPWPWRCLAADGVVTGKGMGEYSANVLGPILLFDELARLGEGDVASYQRARAAAWQWLVQYPLQNGRWVGYFEDVEPSLENMAALIPLELARHLLLHPEQDANWREHARALIDWTTTTDRFPKVRVHGALVSTEQGNAGNFCCNKPNQCCDSHTLRLAAVEALWFARTGDRSARELARGSLAWSTYFQGLPVDAHPPFSNQWWFTDELADGPRRLMDVLAAIPEWAPAGESHLLGSTSAITRITYARGSVRYRAFDAAGDDVLRLDFRPRRVLGDGHAIEWRFEAATGVLRIHRAAAREVVIEGRGGRAPVETVDFDQPHRAAGTALAGEDGQGLHWPAGQWHMAPPAGPMGTFHVALAAGHGEAAIGLARAGVPASLEAWNAGTGPLALRLACGRQAPVTARLAAGELRRVATGWVQKCNTLAIGARGAGALHIDNLALEIDPVASAGGAARIGN